MDVKKVALLIGALVIAVVTAVMAKNMFTGAGAAEAAAAPAVPQGPKVLVARKALPVGTIIDAESLAYQAWPKELVQNAYYTEGSPDSDIAKLLGTVVRNPVTAGQPLTRGALVGPNDRGFLAAALGPGMRAVTVPVSASSGVAGFVFPGDRVDIVLTQDVKGGGDGPPLKVSETIVRNMRVLATDQRTDSKDEEGKTEVKTFSNITLEATPRIAEKIAVAQSMGQLSLSLRSIADNTAELERAVASGQVKLPQAPTPAKSAGCCWRSPTARSIRIRPSPPVVTSRAFSAAASPPWPPVPPICRGAPLRAHRRRVPRRSSAVRRYGLPAATLSPSSLWEHVKMTSLSIRRHARLGTALAALALGLGTIAIATPAAARPAGAYRPSTRVLLSVGEGQMVTLPSSVAEVWTSNPTVADVHVTNPRQINLFGKEAGEATVIATSSNGTVVYSSNVRVSQNITSVDEMLRAAMPEANIKVMNVGQLAVLTGTVASPDRCRAGRAACYRDAQPRRRSVEEGALCKICVVSRLNTATPLQVTLKVRIAEVNRRCSRRSA